MWHKAGRNRDQAGVALNPVPLSVEDELIRKQMMVNGADIKACTSTSLHIFQAHAGSAGCQRSIQRAQHGKVAKATNPRAAAAPLVITINEYSRELQNLCMSKDTPWL